MSAVASSIYPGMEPPPLEDYFTSIHRAFRSLPVSYSSELWCEPGRALSAEFNSMIVQVEKRRGNELFINEGAYGALYDAAHVDWRFPVKRIDAHGQEAHEGAMEEFAFYGPTCDDADYMEGPSSFPPVSSRATISRSACWVPMARRCARVSTALAPGNGERHRRADGQPVLWQAPRSARLGQCRVAALIGV
jgi:hypothetical protein